MRLTSNPPALPTLPALTPRAGTTLVELTVVVVLLALIVGGLLSVVHRQQRFYRAASSVAAGRSQARQAAAILPAELRGISPAAGDIIEAMDSAIEFRSTIASGVVCERGIDWAALAPLRPPGEPALRGELVPPEAGDVAHVLVPDDRDPAADRWPAFAIADVVNDDGLCSGSPFVDFAADAGRPRLRLDFNLPLPHDVRAGAPLRVTRPVRYSLYRSSDRLWYLGADEFRVGEWSGIQPVSGPHAPYVVGGGGGGVHFEYRDRMGELLPQPREPSRLALVSLVIRGAASRSAGGPGAAVSGTAARPDSAVVDVALRNRDPS